MKRLICECKEIKPEESTSLGEEERAGPFDYEFLMKTIEDDINGIRSRCSTIIKLSDDALHYAKQKVFKRALIYLEALSSYTVVIDSVTRDMIGNIEDYLKSIEEK